MGAGCLMHYTWGPILSDKTGAKVWKFDKRGLMGAAGSTAGDTQNIYRGHVVHRVIHHVIGHNDVI